MKKIISIVVILTMLISTVGCSNEKNEQEPLSKIAVLSGEVTSLSKETISIVTTEEEMYNIHISGIEWKSDIDKNIEIGNYMSFEYDGAVMESYPMQINAIRITGNIKNNVKKEDEAKPTDEAIEETEDLGEVIKEDSISDVADKGGAVSLESTKSTDDMMPPVEPPTKPVIEPKPGQLTAGRWNDNENYEFFTELLNENEWYRMKSLWNFNNWDRYQVTLKNNNDEPISNAKVVLHDGNGNIYYSGITSNNGYVVMYPFYNITFIQQPYIDLTIDVDGNLYEYKDVNSYKDNIINLVIDEDKDIIDKVDIMFYIDTTGSMSDELEYLKTELKNVIETVKKENSNDLNIRISVNFYKDEGDEYVIKSYEFTENIDEIITQISNERASGGGDFEEAVEKALEDAVYNHKWRDDADAKLLFLVLDAPPHNTEDNNMLIHETIVEANKKGIRIIPIASSGIDKETEFFLRFLDVSTNGTYIFLTGHSGIGGEHIEPTIGFYQVEQLNYLLIDVINNYIE